MPVTEGRDLYLRSRSSQKRSYGAFTKPRICKMALIFLKRAATSDARHPNKKIDTKQNPKTTQLNKIWKSKKQWTITVLLYPHHRLHYIFMALFKARYMSGRVYVTESLM